MNHTKSDRIYIIIISLLISASVLFQGMYHDGSQYAFMGLFSVLTAVMIFKNKVNFRPSTLLDWFVIACIPVYIISSFTAVSLWDALASVARYITCYLVYFTLKSVIKDQYNLFYRILFYCGSIASLYGIYGGIAGTAFDVKRSILLSVFKYHNTSAVFCSIIFIIGMYLILNADFKERVLICVCNSFLVSTIVYSQSRGTWFVFLVSVIAFIVAARRSSAFSSVMASVGSALIGIVVSMNGFLNAFVVRNPDVSCEETFKCYAFLSLTVLVGVTVFVLCEKTRLKGLLSPKLALLIIPVTIIVAFAVFLFFSPDIIMERIKEFSSGSSTVTERQMFFQDALKIFAKNPLVGIGGNCWQYVYPAFQTKFYTVAHPHSIFAEFMTDAGIFGLLLFVFLVVAFVVAVIKFKGEEKLPAKVAAFLILFHTMFDFDTDYLTILVLLFSFFAIISHTNTVKSSVKAFVIIPVILFLWAVLNGLSMISYNSALKLSAGDRVTADVYEKTLASTKLMPIKADYLTVHGNVCIALGSDRKYLDEAKEVLERSHRLNKYHYQTIYQLAVCNLYMGDYQEAGNTIGKVIKNQPFITESYTMLSNIYEMIMDYAMKSGDTDFTVECTTYACNMLIDNYMYAIRLSEKCNEDIIMGTKTHILYHQAEEILEGFKKIGV